MEAIRRVNKRQNIIVSQFLIFVVVGLFLVCKPLFADGFKITPFILYEEATQNIVIEGVSTKYALGVAGVEFRKNMEIQSQFLVNLAMVKTITKKLPLLALILAAKLLVPILTLVENMNSTKKTTSYSLAH